ncbi:MAG: hypothetical protein J6K84_05815 [Oscillospiraceae bacterium]|nr:hypothetical protein [Oscillospiraceae bacterium]
MQQIYGKNLGISSLFVGFLASARKKLFTFGEKVKKIPHAPPNFVGLRDRGGAILILQLIQYAHTSYPGGRRAANPTVCPRLVRGRFFISTLSRSKILKTYGKIPLHGV